MSFEGGWGRDLQMVGLKLQPDGWNYNQIVEITIQIGAVMTRVVVMATIWLQVNHLSCKLT